MIGKHSKVWRKASRWSDIDYTQDFRFPTPRIKDKNKQSLKRRRRLWEKQETRRTVQDHG